jgi:hypothetical protein
VPGRTLHPAELVLYAPDQYARLPFAPYADDTVMEWVPARSLRDGDGDGDGDGDESVSDIVSPSRQAQLDVSDQDQIRRCPRLTEPRGCA